MYQAYTNNNQIKSKLPRNIETVSEILNAYLVTQFACQKETLLQQMLESTSLFANHQPQLL